MIVIITIMVMMIIIIMMMIIIIINDPRLGLINTSPLIFVLPKNDVICVLLIYYKKGQTYINIWPRLY